MASELRWILLAICVPMLAGIWWWGARRSRQAPGNAELREPTIGSVASAPRAAAAGEADADAEAAGAGPAGWGVSPLEPLSIRTADFEPVPGVEMPMMPNPDIMEETFDLDVHPQAPVDSPSESEPQIEEEPQAESEPHHDGIADQRGVGRVSVGVSSAAPAQPVRATPESDTAATGANEQLPNMSETQRIVTLRVCARAEEPWSGAELMTALENHGLAFGRYQVFHRRHSDGRTMFCAASLVEPGTFDPARMPQETYRGLTLFAVLPGPVEPLPTFDALLQTAGELAGSLHGTLQDSKGVPLSRQRALALREDVARFQSLLTLT